METSNCCDSPRWLDNTDICSKCKEHTDFYDDDDFDTYQPDYYPDGSPRPQAEDMYSKADRIYDSRIDKI